MRDALVLLIVLVGVAVTLRYPFAGVLLWAWFSLMTPHQLAYGVFGVPLNVLIAGATTGSILLHGEYKRFRVDVLTILLFLFIALISFSQMASLAPDYSADFADRLTKTVIFAIVCTQMAYSKVRIHALLWILVLAIGYFGLKGAIFTVATLGQYRVQGIEMTLLEDNNHLGIALATVLPLMLYLRSQVSSPAARAGLLVFAGAAVISILGTHSRGALLTLIAFGFFYWLQSRHKVLHATVGLVAGVSALAFLPSKWMERMSTIGEATKDESFMGRVISWQNNYELAAQNPFTGAGMRNAYQPEIVANHLGPERAEFAIAAHSIYFEILGGAGFVALGVFLSILLSSLVTAMLLRRKMFATSPLKGQRPDDEHWRHSFGYYGFVALAAFMIGGASVSLEMWDGYWLICAIIASMASLSRKEVATKKNQVAPAVEIRKRKWKSAARGSHITTKSF